MHGQMQDKNWTDILMLLSMMVLADEKVYQEEVEAFKKAAVELKDMICPEVMLTEQMALDWFMLHRDDILDRMNTYNYPSAVTKVLENLSGLPDKKMFVMALLKIAVSDGFEHGSESKLINLASDYWNLDLAS